MAEKEGFKNKIIKVFGMEDLDDEPFEDEYEDEYEESTTREEPVQAQVPVRQTPSSAPDVLVLDPVDFNEAPGIVNKLKQDKTVVVNLKQADFDEGRKIFDFLSGAVFALEGSLNRIAESVFILAPHQVSVSTKMEDARSADEYQASILNWDE